MYTAQSLANYGNYQWPVPAYYGCTPGAWVFVPASCCPPACPQILPQELSADANMSAQGFIGGRSTVHFTLECRVDGPNLGQVELTIETDGATSTLNYTDIDKGYSIKDDFIAAEPGSKVTIKTIDASARLRWCETICC